MVVALIVLSVIALAQLAVIYGLINRILLQSRVPSLQPVPIQTKAPSPPSAAKKVPLFSLPIQD